MCNPQGLGRVVCSGPAKLWEGWAHVRSSGLMWVECSGPAALLGMCKKFVEFPWDCYVRKECPSDRPLPNTHTFVGVKHLVELGGSHSGVQDSIDCWEPQSSQT